MNFAGTSISEIAGAMGRTLRNMRTTETIADADFDPYTPAPAVRSDIQNMLDVEVTMVPFQTTMVPTQEEEELRASEKLEHDTMCLIRGALYPVDQT